ncbi:MAG: DUF899 domain-containing protein [Dongiaceae bacterium]
MTTHITGTRAEWLAARLDLLEAEKALTRQSDALAEQRRALPWVRVDKPYRFETEQGSASLADLFGGRSQLLVYHFMLGPDDEAGCPSCSAIADGFDGFAVHLANHDVMLTAVSRAPLPKLLANRKRMGWRFLWASSHGSDFNFDFRVSFAAAPEPAGETDYNFRHGGPRTDSRAGPAVDPAAEVEEMPGLSAFALQDGAVYHTYSTYARGLDGLWGMYQWLDRAPAGRNETGYWLRRHNEYGRQ